MMAIIYNQALANRFGIVLAGLLESAEWTDFEAAVAWVRRSGTRHLLPCVRTFLNGGGRVGITVGVDIENTSREGLDDLLALSALGNCRTYIYHNESPSVTFHPKVYLFTNDTNARLIIGSNNITESGLFTNTEAGLQIDAAIDDQVIVDIRKALESWRDPSEGMAHELDRGFLDELVGEGYVAGEDVLSQRRQQNNRFRGDHDRTRTVRRLFGSRIVTAPIPPDQGLGEAQPARQQRARAATRQISGVMQAPGYRLPLQVTNVLLMRIRAARGTQVQFPIPLRESAFLRDARSITSGHTGVTRTISAARPKRARGKVNTYKVEIPETRGLAVPVMRLDRSSEVIVYYVYDASSAQGRLIMDSLEMGRQEQPPTTVLTRPHDSEHCTWYRFI